MPLSRNERKRGLKDDLKAMQDMYGNLTWSRSPSSRNPNYPDDRAYGVTDDPCARLAYPHHSDERYKKPQTVYGRTVEGKKGYTYLYEDHAMMQQFDRWDAATKHAKSLVGFHGWSERSVRYYETLFTYYYQPHLAFVVDLEDPSKVTPNKRAVIKHVMGGYNWSNGQSYYIFGIRVYGGFKVWELPTTAM